MASSDGDSEHDQRLSQTPGAAPPAREPLRSYFGWSSREAAVGRGSWAVVPTILLPVSLFVGIAVVVGDSWLDSLVIVTVLAVAWGLLLRLLRRTRRG